MGTEKEQLDQAQVENLVEALAGYLTDHGKMFSLFISVNEEDKFFSSSMDDMTALGLIYTICVTHKIPVGQVGGFLQSIDESKAIDTSKLTENG